MKICFFTDTIFTLGGIQRVVSVLASELCKEYEVDIVCTHDKKIDRSLYKLDDKVNVIINPNLFKKSLIKRIIHKPFKVLNEKTGLLNKSKYEKVLYELYISSNNKKNLKKFLDKKQYDIVVGVAGYYSMLLGSISDEIESKTIGWQHNSYNAYLNTPYRYHWMQDELFMKYICKLDKYVVLTDCDKKELKAKLGIKSIRIYNPLSFKSEKKSTLINKNILYVGRLVEVQKGLDLLIESFEKVHNKAPDWNLIIVGDGEDKERIQDKINKKNLSNFIKIHPFSDDVKKYYLNSTIFVSSSRWEGFGLVITEAMECGVPVVAFNNTGPKEIIKINNKNGILVPCKDTKLLADSILYLINNKDERKKISKNSIERAKYFSLENISKEWTSLFKELIRQEK